MHIYIEHNQSKLPPSPFLDEPLRFQLGRISVRYCKYNRPRNLAHQGETSRVTFTASLREEVIVSAYDGFIHMLIYQDVLK